jgi:acetyl-CoA carboxylase biotin carboxyl carrier protein
MQTEAQLQQLAAWLAGTDIGLLELRTPEWTVRLGRDGASSGEVVARAADDDDGTAAAPAPAIAAASSVGLFLHGHPLHAAPLVRIGERVSAGQPVGLLQIGPLLLPVTAPLAGVITAIPVAAGRTVGYGTALVELQAL